MKPPPMPSGDLRRIVIDALAGSAVQVWKRHTYDSGPYEVTMLRDSTERIARAVEAATLARAVPAGWKLVPVAPSDKMMLMGGFSFCGKVPNDEVFPNVRKLWDAMLAAAPEVPAAPAVTDAMVEALRGIEMAACYGTEEDPDAGPSMLRTIGEIARKALAEIDSAQTESKSRTPPAAGGAAMKPPPMPTENHCGTCGAGVTYRSQDVAARDAQWAAIVAILERNNEIKHAQIQNAADEVARLRQELADLERQLRVAKAKHSPEYLQERINLAVAQERERCARVCEAADKSTHPADLADAIRAQTNSNDG